MLCLRPCMDAPSPGWLTRSTLPWRTRCTYTHTRTQKLITVNVTGWEGTPQFSSMTCTFLLTFHFISLFWSEIILIIQWRQNWSAEHGCLVLILLQHSSTLWTLISPSSEHEAWGFITVSCNASNNRLSINSHDPQSVFVSLNTALENQSVKPAVK